MTRRGMTRRERLAAIFEGRVPDRPAVKVWGAGMRGEACKLPAFTPVRDMAADKTDLVLGSGSDFSVYCGRQSADRIERSQRPTDSPEWVERTCVYHTPAGDLLQRDRVSTCGKPGRCVEHLLKEPEDIRKLLSIPYEPAPFSADRYRRTDHALGDGGLVLFGLDHAMYALQRLIGSENFAFWSLEAESLLLEAMQIFAARIRDHAKAALAAGIRGVFGWVGPELCIPPLMSPAAFETFVFEIDKPLIDLIHDAGGHVWVHCHGKMRPVLRRFVDMGVDVLNPIEPPPMGDITMAEAFGIVDGCMGLEGGIETHDFMIGATTDLCDKIHANLEAGAGKRMILCPSSGYLENVHPTPQEIENWLFYIEEGVRYAESLSVDR
ncbi:MAG: hypothetical protein JXR37_26680 [Kiritimatiellae bacterium]|nr:hypothetical protein [Kiritimatiellia bacterium]